MSREDVEIVRRLFDAVSRRDTVQSVAFARALPPKKKQ
jgi:hypothetical protein